MKTILYATDYSKNSAPALRLAHLLAQKFGSKLIVMHVFDIPVSLASPVSVSYMNKEKTLFVENRAKLKAFCTEHLGDEWQGSDISFVVEEHGSVKEAIVEKALKFDVDLIALGTKGASRVKEILLGSTTKALIRKASCAVLAVPETYDIDRFETMVYATDFEEADIFAIRRLVKIAKSFDAEIRVLHITTVNEYAGDQQMEWFKEMVQQKVDYRHLEFDLVFSDNVLKELQWYLEESDVQLLAMLERKDSTWTEKYFQPDMVRKMVSEISVPLLSFNTVGL
jgi:nucleotide-binding universal stress UspA family protein